MSKVIVLVVILAVLVGIGLVVVVNRDQIATALGRGAMTTAKAVPEVVRVVETRIVEMQVQVTQIVVQTQVVEKTVIVDRVITATPAPAMATTTPTPTVIAVGPVPIATVKVVGTVTPSVAGAVPAATSVAATNPQTQTVGIAPIESYCQLGVVQLTAGVPTQSLSWDTAQLRGYMNDDLSHNVWEKTAYCRTQFPAPVTLLFDSVAGNPIKVDGKVVPAGNGRIERGQLFEWVYPTAVRPNGHAFIIQQAQLAQTVVSPTIQGMPTVAPTAAAMDLGSGTCTIAGKEYQVSANPADLYVDSFVGALRTNGGVCQVVTAKAGFLWNTTGTVTYNSNEFKNGNGVEAKPGNWVFTYQANNTNNGFVFHLTK